MSVAGGSVGGVTVAVVDAGGSVGAVVVVVGTVAVVVVVVVGVAVVTVVEPVVVVAAGIGRATVDGARGTVVTGGTATSGRVVVDRRVVVVVDAGRLEVTVTGSVVVVGVCLIATISNAAPTRNPMRATTAPANVSHPRIRARRSQRAARRSTRANMARASWAGIRVVGSVPAIRLPR